MTQLQGFVALVTGASRGAGRAIAAELGAAGAIVYVTGRSVEGGPTTDNVPGTIEDTARQVTERGGRGIAVRCDHTVDADVEALFGRIRDDHGRLDVLVNNVWGGYENSDCRPLPLVPFWEQSLDQWDRMFMAGVRRRADNREIGSTCRGRHARARVRFYGHRRDAAAALPPSRQEVADLEIRRGSTSEL
jgi:NAD(P)-dependent dehydrogenase (short-subunit alcohol dehydrogenase family)